MRKKFLSTVLTICMMLTLLPTMALAEDSDVGNTGLNLYSAPSVETRYKAGDGSITWAPTVKDDTVTGGTLTLDGATITSASDALYLRPVPITIVVKDDNHLTGSSYAIFADSADLTIQGDGTLNFAQTSDSANGINCKSLTIQDGVSVTGNCCSRDIYCTQSLTIDTTGTVTTPKISSASKGTFTYKQGSLDTSSVFAGGGCQISGDYTWPGDHIFQSNLTVSKGATLTIPKDKTLTASKKLTNDGKIVNNGTLTVYRNDYFTNNAKIVNNGTIVLPTGTDAAAIKNMGISLTENGMVQVGHQYYFNDGTKVVTTTLNFTKSAADGNWNESATVDTDGYQWDKTTNTLKLGGLYLSTENTDGIDVPAGTTIELQSGTSSIIKSGSAGSYSIGIDCYGGSDPLTITGSGTLAVTAGEASGDNNSLGIYSDSDILIKNGTITANGGKSANGSSGICSGNGAVTISGGTIQATGGTSTASNATAGSTGIMAATDVTISGGTVTAAGGKADQARSLGVYAAGGTLSLSDGTLNAVGKTAAVIAKTAVTLGASRAITAPSGSSVGKSGDYQTVLSGNAPAVNVSVGAKPSTTSGSDNGSGSSNDRGSDNNMVTVPVSSDAGKTSVSTSVSGSTAAISATASQIASIVSSAKETGTVTVDVSGLKVKAATIPSKVVSAVQKAEGSEGLAVALPTGTVTLDKPALVAVAGKGDMKFSVDTVSNSKLTDTQKAALGAQAETAFVVDVNVYAGGTRTSTFGDGNITVSVPYTLKSGENPDSITVWFLKDDGTIEPKTASYANGKVTFTTEHLSQYLIVDFPFADVAESAWCYGSVAYAYNNGLFSGTSATTFSPNATANRQMIWMVLARMDGKTPDNMAAAKAWAVENNISDGSNPTGTITRQQMAAILYRYAQHKGYDVSAGEDTNILSYGDALTISQYAIPALQWACGAGLVQGKNNQVMPFGDATRAQVATILQRFSQNMAK